MVFLDANILLELVLPNRAKSQAVLNLLEDLDQPTCITTLTVHLLFHFGRQERVRDEPLHATARPHTIIPVTEDDYLWAKRNEAGKDFEDALQVAAAVRAGCTQLITLDRTLAKNYTPVITCVVS